MNLLLPPLIATIFVASYVAIATREHNSGQEKIFVADNMIRHHELAVAQSATFPNVGPVIPVAMAPFSDILRWDSRLAVDTQNRLWLLTYIGPGQTALPSNIGDAAIAGIQFELVTKNYQGGTYGRWQLPPTNTNQPPSLNSTIGSINFNASMAVQAPDQMPMIATLMATSCVFVSGQIYQCSPV